MKTILKESQQQTTSSSGVVSGTTAPSSEVVSGTTGVTTTQAHLGTTVQATTYQPYAATSYVGEVAREVHVEPTVFVEKFERPTIVKETILPQEKIEVQPVIHREREQLEVREVVQPLHERDIAATHVRQATLPAEVRAEVRESDTAFRTSYREATTRYVPEVHTEAVRREVVNMAPIVEEHVHKKIVEEVQPVLYRETVTPVVIEETRPIFEKYVEMPRIVEETKPMVDLGTRYTDLPTSQMSNLSISGQTYQTGGLPYSTGQTYTTGGYSTGQTYATGGHPYGQPMHREVTVTKEVYVEPVSHLHGVPHHPESQHHHTYLPETHHHGTTYLPETHHHGTTYLPETHHHGTTYLPETHHHGTTYYPETQHQGTTYYTGSQQLPKETIVTQETYSEPARATTQPYTETKRIV